MRSALTILFFSSLTACAGEGPGDAASISFDNAGGTIGAATVQAALAELDQRAAAAQAAAEAAAQKADDVQAALDGLLPRGRGGELGAQLEALALRVAALEEEPARAAAAIPYDGTTGPDAADVQAAIQALHAQEQALTAELAGVTARVEALEEAKAALEAADTALADEVAALAACPEDMAPFGDGCIETEARDAITWGSAATVCTDFGRYLCSFEELYAACEKNVFNAVAGGEWSSTFVEVDKALVPDQYPGCSFEKSSAAPLLDFHPYRCCAAR